MEPGLTFLEKLEEIDKWCRNRPNLISLQDWLIAAATRKMLVWFSYWLQEGAKNDRVREGLYKGVLRDYEDYLITTSIKSSEDN